MTHEDEDDVASAVIPEAALQAAKKAVEDWLMLYTLPANYTLDREYNGAVAEANSEQLALAALQAALPLLGVSCSMEWGIFRSHDPEDAMPMENRRFGTQEIAKTALKKSYNNTENWEVRGQVIGGWKK